MSKFQIVIFLSHNSTQNFSILQFLKWKKFQWHSEPTETNEKDNRSI